MSITAKRFKTYRGVIAVAALATLVSCASVSENANLEPDGTAKVDLRVTDVPGQDTTFEPRSSFTVPSNHKIGDKIFPYEGIGWENELIGYRLYLDERAVTDVFGKRTPFIALDKVDYRNDYHALADWGMDVQHVGPSMGVGGLGLYRGDQLERFGNDGQISADVLQEEGQEVSFKITHTQVPYSDGKSGNVKATYTLKSGSPLTWVRVESNLSRETLATGLVKSSKVKRIRNSNKVKKGEWRYIATWGDKQSEAEDGLGTVLFYRDGDARLMPSVNETFALRFNTSNPTYAFGAVWEQGPMGIANEDDFIAWADKKQKNLNK